MLERLSRIPDTDWLEQCGASDQIHPQFAPTHTHTRMPRVGPLPLLEPPPPEENQGKALTCLCEAGCWGVLVPQAGTGAAPNFVPPKEGRKE